MGTEERIEKAQESRLRRKLKSMGYRLMKNRSRDPQAAGYGGYMIVEDQSNAVMAGAHPYEYCFSLDDVKEFIKE